MIDIKDVRTWFVDRSQIGHIAVQTVHGWGYTACEVLSPNFAPQGERPNRICRKCRAMLPKLKKLKAHA